MGVSGTITNVQSSTDGQTKVDDSAVSGPSHITESALARKIDYRIVPTLFLAYLLQFLDKVAINVRYDYPR
jgi:hypothetical protein